MPPKSNKKDQQKPSCYTCDKSNKIVTLNLFNLSQNSGEEFGIENEIFTTKSIITSPPKEVDEPHLMYLQRFRFVPEAICNFCTFTMDCNLLIEINRKFFVRQAFPISDSHSDLIYSSCLGGLIKNLFENKFYIFNFCRHQIGTSSKDFSKNF